MGGIDTGIIVAAIAAVGGVAVAWIKWRTDHEANSIAVLKVLVEEQGEQIDRLQERVDRLESELRGEKDYTASLRDHIYKQLPPPPPKHP
jgi:hypothetical protein